jgi:hypothetical protein
MRIFWKREDGSTEGAIKEDFTHAAGGSLHGKKCEGN